MPADWRLPVQVGLRFMAALTFFAAALRTSGSESHMTTGRDVRMAATGLMWFSLSFIV